MGGGGVAVLRIEGIQPLIWRRVAYDDEPDGRPSRHLSCDGWIDCHLWTFEADGRKYGMYDPDWNEAVEGAKTVTLKTILDSRTRKLKYVYVNTLRRITQPFFTTRAYS
jgi:hypothetical protein